MTPQKLGSELIGVSYAIRGTLTAQEAIRLLRRVIRLIGMRSYGDPIVREWPGESGAGGVGVTVMQSLVESFAVIETWEELDGFYLVIHSCRWFDPFRVYDYLEFNLGYRVLNFDDATVRLVRRPSIFSRLWK